MLHCSFFVIDIITLITDYQFQQTRQFLHAIDTPSLSFTIAVASWLLTLLFFFR